IITPLVYFDRPDINEILKPVVEKKRRDRINQSLGELRTLLLNYTSDVRLQNPKIEKAEILDLAVEYLQKWTDRRNSANGNSGQAKDPFPPLVRPPLSSESGAPTLFSIENAGFQQCMAQLASYMHKISPAERMNLIQELNGHMESQCPNGLKPETATGPNTASVDRSVCSSERREESHHSSCQPGTLSPSIGHDYYLSPPISPYLSSPPAYTSPPPFPLLACHFSFSPSLSPLSSNTSFAATLSHSLPTMPAPVSFSPTPPLSGPPTLHLPSRATVRSPREGLPPNSSSSIWRPFF
uniref:Hairy-related 11 n=1 Tax=Myripristis murdjan TaxID=586833 RepID=A0A667Z7Y3_9TELE